MRRTRVAVFAVVALLAVSSAAVVAAQVPDPVAPPRATLSSGGGAPGSTVLVVGEGWPASSVVQVQVCGNQALNGSADCFRAGAVTQGTDDRGGWNADLPVGVPPTPCPCVVYVTAISGSSSLRLPFEVAGVPSATPVSTADAVPVYRVTEMQVAGGSTLGSLFGGEGDRTVSLTVENTGAAPITALPVEVRVGEGEQPAGAPTVRTIDTLAPGQSATVEVPVVIPAMTTGTATIEAVVGTDAQSVRRTASVTSYPWLLFLVAALVVVGVVVAGAVLLARRRSRAAGEALEAEPPMPPPSTGPPADDVIDLRTGQLILGGAAAGAASGGTPLKEPAAPSAPEPVLDTAALGDDLADELGRVLEEAMGAGEVADLDQLAASVAAEVAAVVGARHRLDVATVQALAAELRDSLAGELGAASGTR